MLRTEWASNASTAEIGRRMGITKSAVIGKAHRMGLPAREAPANIVSPKSRAWCPGLPPSIPNFPERGI
jgi:GcrA cell cycle regulator